MILTMELARFFIIAWDSYLESPSLELEALIEESTKLVTRHEVTQEEVDAGAAPDNYEVGDMCYILTELGQEAWKLVKG